MPHTFRLRKKDRLLGYGVVPLCGAIVSMLLTSAVIVRNYLAESRAEIASIAAQLEGRTRAIDASFASLPARPVSPCSPEHLRALGEVVVSSSLVQDVLYQAGSMRCSAIFGEPRTLYDRADQSASEILLVLPDGSEIRRNVHLRFAPGIGFTLYTRGPNTLVLQASSYPRQMRHDPSQSIAIMAITPAGRLTIDADREDAKPKGTPGWLDRIKGKHLESTACTKYDTYCVISMTKVSHILHVELPTLAFFTLLGGLAGWIAGTMIVRHQAERLSLPTQLRRALQEDALTTLYQPIVDAETGKPVAAEALIRWTRGAGHTVGPNDFIPVAEKTGLIGSITCTVIRHVGRDLAELMKERRDFLVSINIVLADLESAAFYAAISQYIVGRGILPQQVAFEVTERQEVEIGPVTERMAELRQQGFKFYVDDFGTGYSSVSYLGDLPVDALKIDQSFTRAVGTAYSRARLVPPMLDMAREMSVSVVVEGVETEEQASYFRSRGVACLQGWLYGKAASALELRQSVELAWA